MNKYTGIFTVGIAFMTMGSLNAQTVERSNPVEKKIEISKVSDPFKWGNIINPNVDKKTTPLATRGNSDFVLNEDFEDWVSWGDEKWLPEGWSVKRNKTAVNFCLQQFF